MSRTNLLAAAALALLALSATQPIRAADSHGTQVAALFGESDEEKAARQQHEENQDLATQALSQRVHDLEETLRQVTGQNEMLAHKVQELSDKLDRQQKDFEYRLCAMAAQQLGNGPAATAPALPCGGTAGNAAQVAPAPAPSGQGGQMAGKPPGTLGTLSGDIAAAPAVSSARTQLDAGMNLLAKGQYDEARAAFRNVADSSPRDPSASLAIYWIGRIAYVQKDYGGAARAFAEVIKKYPTSASAPESLLKLGQSLLASGQKKEGCTALVALKKKYPGASKTLIEQAQSARRAACKR